MTISTVISMIAAAVSEPESKERKQLSYLEKVTYRGLENLFYETQRIMIAARSNVQGIVVMREI